MSRRTRLHALAWSLPDVQPAAKLSRSYDVRGEAPGAWALCEGCDGRGELLDRFRRPSTCEDCHGAGRYRVDPVTLGRVGALDSIAPTRSRRARCDRCDGAGVIPGRWVGASGMVRCVSCDGTGALSVPLAASLERAPLVLDDGTPLARLRSLGDWGELEAALSTLRHRDLAGWRAWTGCRVGGTPLRDAERLGGTPPPPELSLAVSNAELWLLARGSWRCPAPVMVAFEQAGKRAVAAEAARQKRVFTGSRRKVRVRELVREGLTYAEVAGRLGVSVRSVQRAVSS